VRSVADARNRCMLAGLHRGCSGSLDARHDWTTKSPCADTLPVDPCNSLFVYRASREGQALIQPCLSRRARPGANLNFSHPWLCPACGIPPMKPNRRESGQVGEGILLLHLGGKALTPAPLYFRWFRLRDRPWLIMGIIYVKEELDPNSAWFLIKVCPPPVCARKPPTLARATLEATGSTLVHRGRVSD